MEDSAAVNFGLLLVLSIADTKSKINVDGDETSRSCNFVNIRNLLGHFVKDQGGSSLHNARERHNVSSDSPTATLANYGL